MTAASCACGATWTGTRTEHCTAAGCHQTFTGTTAGDMHRVGPHAARRCLPQEAMVRKGMRAKLNGQGTFVWSAGGSNPFSQGLRDDLGAPNRLEVDPSAHVSVEALEIAECAYCFQEHVGYDRLCAKCSWYEGLSEEERAVEAELIRRHCLEEGEAS